MTEWWLGSRAERPMPVDVQMTRGLFASLPILVGGVLNSVAVAAVAAWRNPVDLFLAWFAVEVALCIVRLPLVAYGRRLIAAGRRPPLGIAAILSAAWAASVGYGTLLCLLYGDWVMTAVAFLSASAMVGGICLRNFGTPRLSGLMVLLTLTPCAIGGLFSGEPIVAMIAVQLPIYMSVIISSAFKLHDMTVTRMAALDDLARSESFVKSILTSGPDYTLVLDREDRIIFYNQPLQATLRDPIGLFWLELLPERDRAAGAAALLSAHQDRPGNLSTSYPQPDGSVLWFDIIVQQIADGSGRKVVVARDITHQKRSEEQALWLARHDAMTGLPNRGVMHEVLDAALVDRRFGQWGALLIIDVDNFKMINDTIGHDGGDALLCAFARRLVSAGGEGALVARTGGDEFAMLVPADSREGVEHVAARIFAHMAEPFRLGRNLVDSGASIGASFLHMDGRSRTEIVKAADIALYAAKSDGRARMKLFEPAMKVEVERRQSMMASARRALQHDRIVPHYQPKILLGSSRVCGFEALLRWKDEQGHLRGPQLLDAALHDPKLGPRLSARMLDRILDDIAHWLEQDLPFGDVALNVTMADFRQPTFVPDLLARLRARNIPSSCLQIEVTESVFLGRTADSVESALRMLSDQGIRIALDDFGTGYASLSHLQRFPVDVLKIDRAFVRDLGKGSDVEAISAAVINLGHCMGLEVVAEGVETRAQEAHLVALGCDVGQGFFYSGAVPAEEVPGLLRGQVMGDPDNRWIA